MVARNLCFSILMALVATNMILAEEEKASLGGFPFSLPSFFGFREGKPSEEAEGRATVADQASNQEHEDRFFFNFRRVTCNYTSQAGSTCVGCRQALNCFSNNFGLLRYCSGFFRYCVNGHCSPFATACNATSG